MSDAPTIPEAKARLALLAQATTVNGLDHLPVVSRENAGPFGADLTAILAHLSRLEEGITRAADWFSDYEDQHRAKGTPDADAKADTNKERALFLLSLLLDPNP